MSENNIIPDGSDSGGVRALGDYLGLTQRRAVDPYDVRTIHPTSYNDARRIGVGTEAAEASLAGDITTLPAGSDTFPRPRRRVGCLSGCRGFSHDAGCSVGSPMPVGTTCSLDFRCKTLGVATLADPDYPTCPCAQAVAAHAGVAR